MIYLEIFGRKEDGITDATKNIIKAILTQKETKQLILIDETSSVIYELGLDEFRMGSVENKQQLKQMIFGKYPERVVYVVPTKLFNISDFMQELMFTQFKKKNICCVYYRLIL